ncbi:MAG: hypothetical protein MRERC_5c080 [Mycoplasmataceae bacterium RC_NB112A]|nr:MAG: hypothetical protein MRERC_5c080 [Mycoplasmataceae bacterium RC_NB112A]
MGNNISNIANINTTNWKCYQVQRVERNSYSIKFFVDRDIGYSDKYSNIINCDSIKLYEEVRAGDFIQVNQGRTQFRSSSRKFTYNDNFEVIRIPLESREAILAPEHAFFLRTGMMNYRKHTWWEGSTEIEVIRYEKVEQGEIFAHQITTKYNY